MTDLGPSGGVSAVAINSSGQITGFNSAGNPYLYSNGVMQDLGEPPNGVFAAGWGINNAGQVVGAYGNNVGSFAFLYNSGIWTDLGNAWRSATATAINNHGEIVGFYAEHYPLEHLPCYFLNGQPIYLDPQQAREGFAQAINDNGQIVGQLNSEAFLYEGGSIRTLGVLPGFEQSYAYGINNSGQIVGSCSIPNAQPVHAFLYVKGAMFDLNNMIGPGSGWTLQRGTAINSNGQIAGFGIDPAGKQEGFLLTPTVGTGPVLVPGDTNGDGTVNFSDLLTLAQNYGSTSATWTQGDFNGDGSVGFDDLLSLAQSYGRALPTTSSPIPEPLSAGMVMAALILLPRLRRY